MIKTNFLFLSNIFKLFTNARKISVDKKKLYYISIINEMDIDDENLNEIDKEKSDFIYENSINLLKELNESNTLIKNRAMLILSYLVMAINAIIYFFVLQGDKIKKDNNYINTEFFLVTLFILYCILAILILKFIIPKQESSNGIYAEPKDFINKNNFPMNVNQLKIAQSKCIQLKYSESIESHDKKGKTLTIYYFLVVLFLFISIIISVKITLILKIIFIILFIIFSIIIYFL